MAAAPRTAAAPLPVADAPGVRVQSFTAYGVARDAVVAVTAPAAFTAPVTIPPAARLLTAVAVPDRIWTTSVAETAAPLRFRVVFEDDGGLTTLYEHTVRIAAERHDRRWFEIGLDLGALAGRAGTLRFETAPAETAGASPPGADAPPGGTAAPTLALWAPPELLRCDDPAPSLLLVTIDALRGDRLSAAGYARPTTPHLDAFAADATLFTAAFAAGPKTIPSIPQLLTGTYYFRHRDTPGLGALLGPDRFTVSRAIVNNPYVAGWLERERPGFQALESGDLDARAITTEALRFLTAVGACRSALYLHYLDTHTPYRPPPPWARRFIDRAAQTTVGLAFADVTGAWQGRYSGADRRRIADLYDGAIAWTDRQLGRLLRGLARRGLAGRTLVVVTADHGEEFWEHGRFFHGQSLYDELMHVPLVIRWPALGHGRRVSELATTVDLVPTIADAAGFPPSPGDGVSLRMLAAGHTAPPDGAAHTTPRDGAASAVEPAGRVVFATVSHAEPRSPPRQAVRSATMKLIRNLEDGSVEVYDLVADPREHSNLGIATPGASTLVTALDRVRARVASRGDHLRLRSTNARPVRYAVTLATDPPVPVVEPDRLSLESDDRVRVREHADGLAVTGTLEPGGEDEIRMDVLATTGSLIVTATLDDAPAPPGTFRLGASGKPAASRIDLADPALAGAPRDGEPPPARASSSGVEIAVWRATLPTTAAPAVDQATRSRLRQLGYAE